MGLYFIPQFIAFIPYFIVATAIERKTSVAYKVFSLCTKFSNDKFKDTDISNDVLNTHDFEAELRTFKELGKNVLSLAESSGNFKEKYPMPVDKAGILFICYLIIGTIALFYSSVSLVPLCAYAAFSIVIILYVRHAHERSNTMFMDLINDIVRLEHMVNQSEGVMRD